MTQELYNRTETLLGYCHMLLDIFEKTKETQKEADFYGEVLPFVNKMKDEIDCWYPVVKEWVIAVRLPNLHMEQIDTAKEHMEIISVQAYFPNTSKARFNHMVQSTVFVLKAILSELKDDYI